MNSSLKQSEPGKTARSEGWTAGLATPLASIFGSGFLVLVSVLGGALGLYAFPAMALVCLVAYLIGDIIRFNIRVAEPMLASEHGPRLPRILETLSDIALVPAYVVSVTLYLKILSSYSLNLVGADTDFAERILTTLVLALILAIAMIKGLRPLQGLEKWALRATAAIIGILLIAFIWHDASTYMTGRLAFPEVPVRTPLEIATVLAGTLIVVQGFETTRYLGAQYEAETRIQASKRAQWISSAVYLALIAAATPLMFLLPSQVSDNDLALLAAYVAPWLPALLVAAAILSQFSAATADAFAAAGNLEELTGNRLTQNVIYPCICLVAALLAWTASTLEILALASRAFAIYYFAQSLVALSVSRKLSERLRFSVLAVITLGIALLAKPVG